MTYIDEFIVISKSSASLLYKYRSWILKWIAKGTGPNISHMLLKMYKVGQTDGVGVKSQCYHPERPTSMA